MGHYKYLTDIYREYYLQNKFRKLVCFFSFCSSFQVKSILFVQNQKCTYIPSHISLALKEKKCASSELTSLSFPSLVFESIKVTGANIAAKIFTFHCKSGWISTGDFFFSFCTKTVCFSFSLFELREEGNPLNQQRIKVEL